MENEVNADSGDIRLGRSFLKVKEKTPEPPLACPAPTREDALKVAKDNTIIFALMNEDFIDFGMNWFIHLEKLKVRLRLRLSYVMTVLPAVLATRVVARRPAKGVAGWVAFSRNVVWRFTNPTTGPSAV